MCRGMAEAQHGGHHVLVWGSSLGDEANMEQQASQACRQLIAKKVSGVFFAPLEMTSQKDAINRGIAEALDRAGIPVVLRAFTATKARWSARHFGCLPTMIRCALRRWHVCGRRLMKDWRRPSEVSS